MRTSLLIAAALVLSVSATAQLPPPDIAWEVSVSAVSITYSADGAHVVSAGSIQQGNHTFGRIDVLAAEDGTVVANTQSHPTSPILGRTNRLSISPDLQTVASAHGGVRCDPMTGCHAERPGLMTWTFPALQPIAGRTDVSPVTAVDFAPDGMHIAAGYTYDNSGQVRIHDAVTLADMHIGGHPNRTTDVAYSPDGSRLATVGIDGMLRLWDAITGEPIFAVHHGTLTVGGWPISVAFAPDGSSIATAGSGYNIRVKVFDAETGDLLLDLDGLMEDGGQGDTRVAFTPNGLYLVGVLDQLPGGSGPWQGRIRFWDATSGEVVEEYADVGPPPYHGGVRSIAFSEAENHLFAYVVGVVGDVKLAETEMHLRDTGDTTVDTEAGPGEVVSLTVYPNPTMGSARVRLELTESQVVRIEIADVLGRRVGAILNAEVAAGGPVTLSLETNDLPGGLYVVRIMGTSFEESRRLSVAR